MRRPRIVVAAAAVALTVPALAISTAGVSNATSRSGRSPSGAATSYVVLAKIGGSAAALARQLQGRGATVTSVNQAIGLVVVTSTDTAFASHTQSLAGVAGVGRDRSIGHLSHTAPKAVDREVQLAAASKAGKVSKADEAHKAGKKVKDADPLDSLLWGMDMVNAPAAHKIDAGDRRVTVGVLDTGVEGSHPDLAANFDWKLSRNFVTDLPDIDGPCEFAGCVDPAGWDDNEHGTHVAGVIAAAANGFGLTGVAPDVTLVDIRGGQDSGYFFLAPVVNALTYAADIGIDVVNMSFYLDPWFYNCAGGAPEDSPSAAAAQAVTIEAVDRALNYAHAHGVTLVSAAGNNHDDMSNPRHDTSSPDYGFTGPYERTISNATCLSLPVEGPHVLGISSFGPLGKKSDFSDYTTDPTSGEIDFSAPGGLYSPTDLSREILSTAPTHVMVERGFVDAAGTVTPVGAALGVRKACNAQGRCGFYEYLGGTSMAAPHAAGVAALAVSAHGHQDADRTHGLTLSPDVVAALMTRTATDHACPAGGVQSYAQEGLPPEFDATCVGTPELNGFFGAGIVNALGVLR